MGDFVQGRMFEHNLRSFREKSGGDKNLERRSDFFIEIQKNGGAVCFVAFATCIANNLKANLVACPVSSLCLSNLALEKGHFFLKTQFRDALFRKFMGATIAWDVFFR